MALVYQLFHSMAFKWFPCLFPMSQWRICTQLAASSAVPRALRPLELVPRASPVIDSCSPAWVEAADV